MPTDPSPTSIDPARVLAALDELGWPDDRGNQYPEEPLIPAEAYYRLAEDVVRAVDAVRPPADPSLRDQIINAISPHAAACQDNPCRWCDTDHARADAVLALVAEYQGQPATEPAEPDPFDHVLEVRGGGRWAIDHPDSCSDPATCLVAKTAYAPAFSARGVPDGLYQAGVNDLGDRLLIGDRIDPPDRQ